jgi:hypothetical protein
VRKTAAARLVLLACAAFSACAKRARPFSVDTAALVAGRPVSLRAFRVYFEANSGRPIAESSPKVVSGLFDQFLREEIWRAAAKLSGSDDVVDRLNAPSLLLSRAGSAVLPTTEDVQREYDLHRERYRKPEQVRVERIFTKKRDEADSARLRISKGEDFAKVAQAVSRSPDAASGGQMGWVERGDLPSEFEEAIFRLRTGEMSPVIAAEEGYLIFKAEDRVGARELTIEQAGPEIRRRLLREKADRYLQSLVENARRGQGVRVFPDRLPFVYTGEFLPPGKES